MADFEFTVKIRISSHDKILAKERLLCELKRMQLDTERWEIIGPIKHLDDGITGQNAHRIKVNNFVRE